VEAAGEEEEEEVAAPARQADEEQQQQRLQPLRLGLRLLLLRLLFSVVPGC